MQKIGALLLLVLLIIVGIFIVFEDETPDTLPIPVEDTTEIITNNESAKQEDKRFKLAKPQDEVLDSETELPSSDIKVSQPQIKPDTFTLINTKTESHNLTISDQKLILQNNTRPIVIVNIFATWCPPCTGQIPYLNDLQKIHKTDLFVIGILTHDTIVQSELETFMAKNQVNYFISNSTHNNMFANLLASTLHLPNNFSIPLTVMYVKGEYFTHYEGSVPVEMIEYDIQQAKKQLKLR